MSAGQHCRVLVVRHAHYTLILFALQSEHFFHVVGVFAVVVLLLYNASFVAFAFLLQGDK